MGASSGENLRAFRSYWAARAKRARFFEISTPIDNARDINPLAIAMIQDEIILESLHQVKSPTLVSRFVGFPGAAKVG